MSCTYSKISNDKLRYKRKTCAWSLSFKILLYVVENKARIIKLYVKYFRLGRRLVNAVWYGQVTGYCLHKYKLFDCIIQNILENQ